MIRIQLNVAASGQTHPPSPTVWPFLANGNPLASLSPWTLTARGVPVTSLDCHTLHRHVLASPFAGKTPVTSRVVLLPSGHCFLSPRSLSLQRSLAVPPAGYTVAPLSCLIQTLTSWPTVVVTATLTTFQSLKHVNKPSCPGFCAFSSSCTEPSSPG